MPTFAFMLLSQFFVMGERNLLGKESKQREQTHHPPPPWKEQRACGINQNTKHNNEVSWEREPCDCVPACTPLRDSGWGAPFFLARISPPDVTDPFTTQGID